MVAKMADCWADTMVESWVVPRVVSWVGSTAGSTVD
jgi:hypothetical protein